MKLRALLRDVPVTAVQADPETEIGGICYDSRKVRRGDLFVAIRGLQSDGHRFIPSVLDQGAAAVLCQEPPAGSGPWVTAEDTRKSLALVSAAWFGWPTRRMTLIGVTGTNGKTTSTFLIKHMLEQCLHVKVGLVGTIANWIGDTSVPAERTTPESYDLQELLFRMAEEGCTHVVMEVSSHALALDRVVGVHFAAGLFTNLTQDHLDFHGTMENYAAAKASLFSQCDRGAVNTADPWADFMLARAGCPILTYSDQGPADLQADDVVLTTTGVHFTAAEGSVRVPVDLGLPGSFSVENALTALAAGRLLDLPLGKCAASLATARGVRGRVEVVPTGSDYVIVIDYAHTPDALEKILRAMRSAAPDRLVVLFGCGGDRDRSKRPLMGAIAAREADFCVVTSDNPRSEEPLAIIEDILRGMPEGTPRKVIADRPAAIRWAMDNHRPGDVIVLAGKGHETYQEIGGERKPMDERVIVAEHRQEMAQV